MYGYGIPKGSKCKTARVKVDTKGKPRKTCASYAKPGESFVQKIEVRYEKNGKLYVRPQTAAQKKVKSKIEIRYVGKRSYRKEKELPKSKVEKAAEVFPEVAKTAVDETNKKYRCLSDEEDLIKFLMERDISLDSFVRKMLADEGTRQEILDEYYAWFLSKDAEYEEEIDSPEVKAEKKKPSVDKIPKPKPVPKPKPKPKSKPVPRLNKDSKQEIEEDDDSYEIEEVYIPEEIEFDYRNMKNTLTNEALKRIEDIQDSIARFFSRTIISSPAKIIRFFTVNSDMNRRIDERFKFPYIAIEILKKIQRLSTTKEMLETIVDYITEQIYDVAVNYMREFHPGELIDVHAINYVISKDPEITNFFNYMENTLNMMRF